MSKFHHLNFYFVKFYIIMNSYASYFLETTLIMHKECNIIAKNCSQTWLAGEIRSSDITTHNNYYKGHYEYKFVLGKSLEPLHKLP